MPVEQVTLKQVILELADFMSDLAVTGTADSGSASQLIDTALSFDTDGEIDGYKIAILAGVGIGEQRVVKTFTQSDDKIVPDFNFVATIDNTSEYMLTRRYTLREYLQAVTAAVRHVIKTHLIPLDDVDGDIHEIITLNDILSTNRNGNGQMEKWAAGVSAAPDGWTADGNTTIARDSATGKVSRGQYSAKMTSDGTNLAQLTQTIKFFQQFAGRQVTLLADVLVDTASRALIRVSDGVATDVTDSYGATASIWEALEAKFTLNANPTKLQVDLEITAGGAVIANWDNVRLISGGVVIWVYDLSPRLMYLSGVQMAFGSGALGTNRIDSWMEPMNNRSWRIERGGNPELQFVKEYGTPLEDRAIRLMGQAHPDVPTVATPATALAESFELNAEYVKSFGKWYLLSSGWGDDSGELQRLAIKAAREEMEMAAHDLASRPMPNSVPVRVL